MTYNGLLFTWFSAPTTTAEPLNFSIQCLTAQHTAGIQLEIYSRWKHWARTNRASSTETLHIYRVPPITVSWNLTSPRLEIHMPLLTFPLCSLHYCHLIVLQVYKTCPWYWVSHCIPLWSLCFTFYSSLYSFQSVFTFVTTFVHSTYLKGSH